ncbi:MAG: flap endonuclease-1 [archaeon]
MGTKIADLFEAQQITLDDLRGKTLVVDTYNQLYMYLATIRQPDGSLLVDSKGQVTSHLSGLFFRFTNLMKHGVNFIFVFDGKPPDLKRKEQERRKTLKEEAAARYDAAKKEGDVAGMRKYAQRTSKLTPDMLVDAKRLIAALGFPVVQAPSEGEAQAAHIVSAGKAHAILSQDADSFLFGAPRVIKNLTISQRRKKANALSYEPIQPELISLKDNLARLNITREQLILMALLTGTDFNIGGIKGIGPKKAYDLITKHVRPEDAFIEAQWDEHMDVSWKELLNLFVHMPVEENVDLSFASVNAAEVKRVLLEHDFTQERIDKALADIMKPKHDSLSRWL